MDGKGGWVQSRLDLSARGVGVGTNLVGFSHFCPVGTLLLGGYS